VTHPINKQLFVHWAISFSSVAFHSSDFYWFSFDRHSINSPGIYTTFFFVTAEPLPLMDICRRIVRRQIGKENLNQVDGLPIPTTLKGYLLYKS